MDVMGYVLVLVASMVGTVLGQVAWQMTRPPEDERVRVRKRAGRLSLVMDPADEAPETEQEDTD